jgi:hypothetical protein
MHPQTLRDLAQRASPPLGDALGDSLGAAAAGGAVYVIGNGPSAARFDPAKFPPGSRVIVCNGAIALYPQADVWLTSESTVYLFEWFYGHESFAGAAVWEQFCTNGASYLSAYPGAFLRRVLWHNRRELNDSFDIRRQGDGLVYVEGTLEGEAYGSVALQAIHLAGIMGASEAHLFGAELFLPDGQQHADGWQPYGSAGPDHVQPVTFRLEGDTPVEDPAGPFTSTPFFLESAAAIRTVLAHPGAAGLRVIDHSAGLLSPAEMNKRASRTATRAQHA